MNDVPPFIAADPVTDMMLASPNCRGDEFCNCAKCWALRERKSMLELIARMEADVAKAKAQYSDDYRKARDGR